MISSIGSASPRPVSKYHYDGEEKLGPLERVTLSVGKGLLRLGTGGSALVGALVAAAALGPVGAPLGIAAAVGGIGGYLLGDSAKKAHEAYVQGPNSDAWRTRKRTDGPEPPRPVTVASAGSEALMACAMAGGFALGHLIFGPTAAGIMTGFGLALATGLPTGYAAGKAERQLTGG